MKLPQSSTLHHAVGITLGMMSALFFTTGMLSFKLVRDISSPQIVFFRVCFAATLTASYTALHQKPLFMPRNPYVWLIGICCIVTNYFFFFALRILSMGDASVIFSTQPIVVGIFAYIFLKESFDLIDAVSTFFIIIGVILVVQPIFILNYSKRTTPMRDVECEMQKRNQSLDMTLHYTAANETDEAATFINSLSFVTKDELRKLHASTNPGNVVIKCVEGSENGTCQCTFEEHAYQDGDFQLSRYWACSLVLLTTIASTIIFFLNGKTTDVFHGTIMTHSNVIVLLGGLLMTTALGDWSFPQKVAPWGLIGAMTFAMICAQVCEMVASKYETATALAIVKTFQTPFCFVGDIVFLRDFPRLLDVVGALLVMGAVLLFAIRHYLREKDADEGDSDDEMQTIVAK